MFRSRRGMLRGTVALVTGASRGVGREVAFEFARRGANVCLLGRSETEPSHASLDGTLSQVADEVAGLGAEAVTIACNLGEPEAARKAARASAAAFGRLDFLVCNASAVYTSKTPSPSQTDLMLRINSCSTLCLLAEACPELSKSPWAGVVSISPPLSRAETRWFTSSPAYAVSKFGMTIGTLGFSDVLCANTLWPQKFLATAATKRLEKETGIPCFSRGLPPTAFAEAVVDLATSYRSGFSGTDEEWTGRKTVGIDDIFV